MSLKGVELQIAIPKTVDAGKIAEQKQQRAQLMQDQANVQMERMTEKNKETVMNAAESAKTNRHKQQHNDQHQDEEHRDNEENKKTRHPYKGTFVDFSR